MRWIIVLLFASSASFAAPKTKAPVPEPTEGRPPFILNFRGGFVLDNPDRAVTRKWEHQSAESFQLALSGFYSFPRSWKQIFFFAGPEFYYRSAKSEISGPSYTSTIDISILQFMLTAGVAYQPYFLGGDWGVSLATAFQAWGQKSATLDSVNITQDLGTEDTRDPDELFGLAPNVILSFYYDLGNFRPQLVFETNSTIGLGMAYAF